MSQFREGMRNLLLSIRIYSLRNKNRRGKADTAGQDLKAVLNHIRQGQWIRGNRDNPFKKVKRSFVSARKRSGITDVRFHDLRCTYVNHYVMRGSSIRGLQKTLGHKDMHMAMRHSSLSKEFAREEIQIMNGLTSARPESGMSSGVRLATIGSFLAITDSQ